MTTLRTVGNPEY